MSMEACWTSKLAPSKLRMPHAAAAQSPQLTVSSSHWTHSNPGALGKTQHASSGAFEGFIGPFILAPRQPVLSQDRPSGKGSAPVSKCICPF